MKRLLLVGFFLAAMLVLSILPAQADGSQTTILCLPDIYLIDAVDCLPAGPSAFLTQMAEQGITFPLVPLASTHPDPSYTLVDYRYGLVRTTNAPVYASIDDALNGMKKNAVRRIDSPFSYISYTEEAYVDGKRFYMIDPGAWMTANDVSRIGAVPLFQGLTFQATPQTSFGWVLTYLSASPVESKRTPGYENQDYTGHIYNHLEVVPIYSVTKVGELEWFLVGPDEWLPKNVVARVIPDTNPPEGVPGDRWIEINLYEQTIAVYDNRQLVFATLVATGFEPLWTRPGLFQIYQKLDSTPMRGSFAADGSDAYYLEDVPWTMYFDEARAIHGAYWRANLGFPQSHGCVNMTVGDSAWIYDWAEVGDWVYVWDPSGKTPTDPSLYTAGGA